MPGLISELGALFPDPLGKLRAYCFLVYCLFSIPCIMTLNALRQEYGTRLMLKSIAIMLALPYAVSLLLFQLGRLRLAVIGWIGKRTELSCEVQNFMEKRFHFRYNKATRGT